VRPALASLSGGGVATYSEFGPRGVSCRDHPFHSLGVETREVHARFVGEHPLVNYCRNTTDGAPVKISDFLDARSLHRLNLHEHFLRPLPVEHRLAITLAAPGPL